jgi:hypothetical protein
MPFYFGDYGLVNVRTDSVGVHQLPNNWTVVSGVAAPAAATGTKTFAAKARVKVSAYCFLGYVKELSASRGVKVTASATLHTSPVYLDAVAGMKISPVRLILEVNASSPTVHLDGALYNKVTSIPPDLAIEHPVSLDGLLGNKVTLTGDLYWRDGKRLEGTLLNTFSLTGELSALGIAHGGIARMRTVGNLAVLRTGPHHHPEASVVAGKWATTATVTVNYMRALLRVPIGATCALFVDRKFVGSNAVHWTASADLNVLNTMAASVAMHWGATASLFLPLRANVAMHWTASAVPDVSRRLVGSTQQHLAATLGLYVVRNYQASVGAKQTATATLAADRWLGGTARLHSTASAGLQVDRWLAGIAPVRWTASMALTDTRPTYPPVGADITVMPDLAFETFPLPVQVESPDTTVYVEE